MTDSSLAKSGGSDMSSDGFASRAQSAGDRNADDAPVAVSGAPEGNGGTSGTVVSGGQSGDAGAEKDGLAGRDDVGALIARKIQCQRQT